jgi:betaine reductase
MARAVRGGLYRIYKEEKDRAEAAGLSELLAGLKAKAGIDAAPAAPQRNAADAAGRNAAPAAGRNAADAAGRNAADAAGQQGPAKKVVHHEIEGIDVLEIDGAVKLLLSRGIYCQAAMGCTGPIVLVAPEDAPAAGEHLRSAHFLS